MDCLRAEEPARRREKVRKSDEDMLGLMFGIGYVELGAGFGNEDFLQLSRQNRNRVGHVGVAVTPT